MKTKEKKNIFKIAFVVLCIITVIIAVVLVIKLKELSDLNKKYKDLSLELEQLKDGVISMSNNSDDNKKEEYEKFDGKADYDPETDELSQEYWLETYEYLLGKFFATYGLTDDGISLIYTRNEAYIPISLELYIDENEKNQKYQKSNETVNIDGKIYDLYKTNIDYKTYKNNLMQMMSEEVFENYFTTYAKEIDGELYIVNESTDNENEDFIINSVELVENNKYKVKYTHTNGDEKEEKEVTATFALNEEGSVIVDEINL